MMRFVLDASVALGWFVDRPAAPYAERVKRALLEGARAVVPALWHVEMANGIMVAERRRVLTAADTGDCLTDLEMLLAQVIDTNSGLTPMRQVLATARTYRLSAYDALYLDMARAEELPLATLDRALRAAAAQAGVELLS